MSGCHDDDHHDHYDYDAPYGPAYVDSLVASRDQLITPEALDLAVPLDGRWPEPRLLDQTDVFYLRDRTELPLDELDADDCATLLRLIRSDTALWHRAAVIHEDHTTSTALRWAYEQAGVPTAEALAPDEWLDQTRLVRWLTARAAPPES